MSAAIKVLLLALELIHSIINERKAQEFKNNVEKIKEDPVSYARAKFGRMRNDADMSETEHLPDRETDTGGDGLGKQ